MRIPWLNIAAVAAAALAVAVIIGKNVEGRAAHHLLNVSYDPTRELYQDINPLFAAAYEKETGSSIAIKQSHGGSSYQARRVAQDEEPADVVTLGLPSDVEALHKRGLVPDGWSERLPKHSQPYHSTIVFVVRKGNPHGVRDWADLLKPGVEVILPDPKTSGNGKLAALAAWGAIVTRGGSEAEAREFLRALYDHAPFLVAAARAAGVAFSVERKGDVHVAWENEALRETETSKGELEIVYPTVSILAEPTVAVVDTNAAKHSSVKQAQAYLQFLFTPEAQEIIAKDGYRPVDAQTLARHARRLPAIDLFPIAAIARDWQDAQQKFFSENGIIDTVYTPKPRTE